MFSVIIPTHNRDNFLKQAVESAIYQAYKPVQIVIIDDVPSMSTRELVNTLKVSSGCEIIYLENTEHRGAPGSRNIGVKYAKGNFLAFLDDDDFWHRDYLKRVAETITSFNVDIVLTKVTKFSKDNSFVDGKIPPDTFNSEEFFLVNPGVLCSNFVVKKNRFCQIGGYDNFLLSSCDKDIFIRLMKNGCSYHVIKESLVYWRINHTGQWSQDYRRTLPGVIRFYRKYFKEMSFIYHLKMLKKILKLTYYGYKQYSR